jgi:hypothetical protein
MAFPRFNETGPIFFHLLTICPIFSFMDEVGLEAGID